MAEVEVRDLTKTFGRVSAVRGMSFTAPAGSVTGFLGPNGSVTIWAITSTVSGNGDQGADPNQLVMITDQPGATSPAAGESFNTVRSAGYGEVLRGVSFTPGTGVYGH